MAEAGSSPAILNFGDHRRGWDFRSPGRGGVNFEEIIRALNDIGYEGPLSIEWEDSGMERTFGAREACEFTKKLDFSPSNRAFDAAFDEGKEFQARAVAWKRRVDLAGLSGMIEITVNGERVSIAEPMTVEQVLDTVEVPPNYLAVEVNARGRASRGVRSACFVRGTSWRS